MKNLNKIEMIADIKEDVSSVIKYTRDMVEYNDNPIAVMERLYSEEPKDVYKDIIDGLRGEYTHDKAYVLGRGVLLARVKEEVKDIEEDVVELKNEYLNNLNNVIKINVDGLVNGIDITTLKDKYKRILESPARKELLVAKINSVLADVVSDDLVSTITPVMYLAKGETLLKHSYIDKYLSKVSTDRYNRSNEILYSNLLIAVDDPSKVANVDLTEKVDVVDMSEQHTMVKYLKYDEPVDVDALSVFDMCLNSYIDRFNVLNGDYDKLHEEVVTIDFTNIDKIVKTILVVIDKYVDGDLNGDKMNMFIDYYKSITDRLMDTDTLYYHNAIATDLKSFNDTLAIIDQVGDALGKVIFATMPKDNLIITE